MDANTIQRCLLRGDEIVGRFDAWVDRKPRIAWPVLILWLAASVVAAWLILVGACERASAQLAAPPPCDSIDFNRDGLFPDTADIDAFRDVLGGAPCATGGCGDIDFNNDGVFPDPEDLQAFLRVFSGGPCWPPLPVLGPDYVERVKDPADIDIHVSSSAGDDRNDGSAAYPVKSLAVGYAMLRHGTGDGLLLKRGDVFPDYIGMPQGSANKSGAGEGRRQWIGAYGDPSLPRPVVRGGSASSNPSGAALRFQSGGGVRHVVVDGIVFEFVAGGPGKGISYWSEGEDIIVQDCLVDGFAGNISLEGIGSGLSNARLIGCALLDATPAGSHSQGLFIDNTTGRAEWCLLDNNGKSIAGDGTIFNHDAYLTLKVPEWEFWYCVVARGSATGLQLRGRLQSAWWCLALDNPLGITTGHAQIDGNRTAGADGVMGTADDVIYWGPMWPEWSWQGIVAYCLIVGGGDIAPNQPDRLPRGFQLGIGYPGPGARYVENIVVQVSGGQPRPLQRGGRQASDYEFRGNIVYGPVGIPFEDDLSLTPLANRKPLGPGNEIHEGLQPPATATFEAWLGTLGIANRAEYIAACRASWSKAAWRPELQSHEAYSYVKARLAEADR